VAIAWVRAQQARSVIVPILGARSREQIEDNLRALQFELSEDELAQLDAASAIELGFPHDFGGARLAYGNAAPLIDDHRGTARAGLAMTSMAPQGGRNA
jgi:hypothetical protein